MVLGFHSDDIGYFEQIGDLGNLGNSNHLLVEEVEEQNLESIREEAKEKGTAEMV